LVLLHGLGSSARQEWGRVMPALAQDFHVLALDHLGFGQSDKPDIPYGIQTWVDMLGEFLRAKKMVRFVLVGESLGGWIALQYAAQALQGESAGPAFALPQPQRLVLCDSAGLRAGLEPSFEHKPITGTGISLAGQKALLGLIYRDPAFITQATVAAQMQATLTKGDGKAIASVLGNPAILNEAVDGKLAAITIPALVVWGEQDAIVPLPLGQRLAAELPRARLVVIPGVGHAPMIEAPQAFVQALQAFLTLP
jgi:pimeloyl-ACP methyl ester carboxylesterase